MLSYVKLSGVKTFDNAIIASTYGLFITKAAQILSDCSLCPKYCNYIKQGVLSKGIQPNLVIKSGHTDAIDTSNEMVIICIEIN